MPEEQTKKLRVEIAHVLFIDAVGYSKLTTEEQAEVLPELNRIVRNTEAASEADAAGQLIILPTGDGMALVFTGSVEEPVECALQISQALRVQPSLSVRMGIHSGPVHHVSDVNQRDNIAGAGINIAQRVMDCGDGGHILMSKRVADDLAQYRRWQPYLHELGNVEVKHGVVVSVVNLYADVVGNPVPPAKFRRWTIAPLRSKRAKRALPWHEVALLVVLLVGLVAAGIFFFRHSGTPPPLAAEIPEKSVAVLPFDNLSEDKANEFFASGVQDEILTDLAKIADLKVISRSSVMQYKTGAARNLRKIAEELGVAHVVEGTVQRSGNKVRVNAQLIDARQDAHLWAQSYDRDLNDVFAIQSEIAESIAKQLQAKLTTAEQSAIEQRPTADVAAFDLYTHAKTLILTLGVANTAETHLRDAIALLENALGRDPKFHRAYCLLAFAHDRLYAQGFDHTRERLDLAEAALRHAIDLQPDSAETHLAKANHLYLGPRDYTGARAELELAARGLPNDSRIPELTGYIVRRQGQREAGVRLLDQALTRDPLNVYLMGQIALSHDSLRRYADEAAVLNRALQTAPDDLSSRTNRALLDFNSRADPEPLCRLVEHVRLTTPKSFADVVDSWVLCALAKRDWAAAEQALVAVGEKPAWVDNAMVLKRQFAEGLLARAMHDDARPRDAFMRARGEQEKIAAQQKDYGPPLCALALIDAALGNKQAALEEGRRAMELLPREKDATNGEMLIGYFAVIAAWTGENELAIEQLRSAITLPGATGITNYGALKLLPFWDPLRGDKRFDEIVASLAPK
ncbi:MAG TPA: FlgO family outer membrane protein [Chthoniobacterales bacterium]